MNHEHELNDLGLPMLTHWVEEPCRAVAPGDTVVDEAGDVDCLDCLSYFERIKQRQRKMNRNRWSWFRKVKLMLSSSPDDHPRAERLDPGPR
jgi:hypothetical protein